MNNLLTQWTTWNNAQLIESGILEIGDGYRAKNSEMGLTGLPFAHAGNIDNGFHFEHADLLDEMNVPKVANKISRPGDVVFTSKGTH
jgi:type I restriction enzyme S subunit